MSELISIIIPVYNGEKYISRMIDSILGQTYKNYELIIVNDGSNDDTFNIISQYSSLENVVIIDKENTGVSDTRNVGLNKANGDYIIFLDADDYVEKEFLEKLYFRIKEDNSDVAMCQYKEISAETIVFINDLKDYDDVLDSIRIKQELIPSMIANVKGKSLVKGLVWRTLIKKKLIHENRLLFDKNIAIAEDMIFLMQVYYCANSISIVKDHLYNYYRYEGSTLTKYFKDNFNKNMYFHDTLIDLLKKQNIYLMCEHLYLSNRFSMYTTSFSNCMRNKNGTKEQYREFMEFYKYFYTDEYARKIKFSHIKGSRKIIYILMKLRFKYLIFIAFKLKEKIK